MRSKEQTNLAGYEQIGGNLCLDFVNTVGGGRGFETNEYLKDYVDLISWGQIVGNLSRSAVQSLVEQAKRNPDTATEVLNRAHTLREAIYRVVTAPFHKRSASPEDLFLISREASFAMGRAKIVSAKNGFSWAWPESNLDLDRVLWPVARAASDLITSPDMERVRECASERCTWVFLDTSKNHSRRWCDMKDCGNREKVRRYRMR